MITAFAPSKLILFGEHAVVYGEPAIATAIALGTRARVRESDEIFIEAYSRGKKIDDLKPIEALIEEARRKYSIEGLRVEISSEVPMGAGMGSSASSAVATAAAIVYMVKKELDYKEIISLADVAERVAHGKPSGIDTRIITYGGTMLYRRGEEPIFSRGLSGEIYIFNTGISRSTRDLVLSVKSLVERSEIARRIISLIGSLSLSVWEKIERGISLEALKEEALINHGLLKALGVSHPVLDLLVYEAKKESKGAKLTGAGGGGSAIGFGRIASRERILEEESFNKLIERYKGSPELFSSSVGAEGVRIL